MYAIQYTNRFKKDIQRCFKRGLDISAITLAISLLQETGSLPQSYKPHKLSGNKKGQWECHIKPDWLMVWEQDDAELRLLFLYTGTHADLFGK